MMTPAEEDALVTEVMASRLVPELLRNSVISAIRAAVAAERERLGDEISDAIQGDLENGVKWLNEMAADDFKRNYPAINAILGKIAAAIRKGE